MNDISHDIYSHADKAPVLCVDHVYRAQQSSSVDKPNNAGDDTPVSFALAHAYILQYLLGR